MDFETFNIPFHASPSLVSYLRSRAEEHGFMPTTFAFTFFPPFIDELVRAYLLRFPPALVDQAVDSFRAAFPQDTPDDYAYLDHERAIALRWYLENYDPDGNPLPPF